MRADAEQMLLDILCRHDPKWLASKLGKADVDPEYSNVSGFKFGEFTAKRISTAIEESFLVCLPLSVDDKNWIVDDYLDYILERASKPHVNIKLARDRIHSVRLENLFVGILFCLPFFVVSAAFIAAPSLLKGVLALLAILGPISVASMFWSNRYYKQLATQIEIAAKSKNGFQWTQTND